jgi:hypothetical protein
LTQYISDDENGITISNGNFKVENGGLYVITYFPITDTIWIIDGNSVVIEAPSLVVIKGENDIQYLDMEKSPDNGNLYEIKGVKLNYEDVFAVRYNFDYYHNIAVGRSLVTRIDTTYFVQVSGTYNFTFDVETKKWSIYVA